jgi:GNAT superfamily N-acetyltransferase
MLIVPAGPYALRCRARLTSNVRRHQAPGLRMRHLLSSDYEYATSVADEWWGGRPVRHLLPRLFFEHFSPTSFAVPGPQGLKGFLIGFRSQAYPNVGYIHFVGVSPEARGRGVARSMYNEFFRTMSALKCNQVRCITSPVNTDSVAFHTALGFNIEASSDTENGYPVIKDYAGPGQSRVLFRLQLSQHNAA